MDVFDKYVGQVFDKRYKILKIIGIGGMAVVFEAIDTVMRRTVALKMLKDDISNDSQSVRRFINESKAVSMLSHPNIVTIFDVSVKEDHKYIVMERVDGITLKSYITKKGMLSFKETLGFTEQILKALEHAHSKGIIHRDIKPQNIMVLKNGRIKVTDFGIAKLPNAETVTMTDKAIGTVFYISPEQASAKPIDQRSDLYSLGVVMYEMTTGTLPFTADSPVSVALMQVNQAPVPPHELNQNIPVGLEQIILTSMEKQPELRFQNTTQMLRHIAQLKSNPGYTFKPRSQQGAHNYNAQYRRRPNVVTEKTLKTVVTGSIPKQGEISVMKKKPRKRNTSMLPIITGITAAFLLVAGAAAIYIITLFFNPSESEAAKSITIPNFIGQAYNETFEKDLTSTYYRIFVEPVYSEDYPPNTIIEQSPKAGEVRKVIQGKQFCDLSLTVSKGVQTIVLNDYTVMDYREVQNELRALGLVAETLPAEYSDTILQGYVIKTEPAAGTSVTVGDTVKLYVSKGQQIVEVIVPNFVGMTEEEARKALDESNLSLGDVKYVAAAEDQLAGVVIDQSIPAYREVPEKVTKIDFTITE